MKKSIGIFFAFAMILSLAFFGDALSANNPLSVQAQEMQTTRTGRVVIRRRNRSVPSKAWRGTKYVGRKSVEGTRYVAHKTKRGTIYVGKKTYQGGKYAGKKTVQGTRYTAHKTKRGVKATASRTKKILGIN